MARKSSTALARRPEAPLDPLADVPAYDPAKDDASNPPAPHRKLTLLEAKERLTEKAQELITAAPHAVRDLAIQIQRLRVAILILQEADTGESNPDTQRELGQLSKLLTGQDLSDLNPDEEASEQRRDTAEAVLAARGLSPVGASAILRAFTAILEGTPEAYRGNASDRRSGEAH